MFFELKSSIIHAINRISVPWLKLKQYCTFSLHQHQQPAAAFKENMSFWLVPPFYIVFQLPRFFSIKNVTRPPCRQPQVSSCTKVEAATHLLLTAMAAVISPERLWVLLGYCFIQFLNWILNACRFLTFYHGSRWLLSADQWLLLHTMCDERGDRVESAVG
jgi:hypothetical protein